MYSMESNTQKIVSENTLENFNRVNNLGLVKDTLVQKNIISLMTDMRDVFVENRMQYGMVFTFFQDCLDGQILIDLDRKPTHYINKLSDFYIDDRVGFKGIRRVRKIVKELKKELLKVD